MVTNSRKIFISIRRQKEIHMSFNKTPLIKTVFQNSLRICGCLMLCLLFACSDSDNSDNGNQPDADGRLDMVVFSDPHYYDPSLGTSGDAFEAYLAADRKLIAESEAIMESLVTTIEGADADIVLVPGDLTMDGVRLCHEKVAAYLDRIEASGKKVYVVPGNHDISNPASFSYPESGAPVLEESVSPADFESIYARFGYEEAIYRDTDSLSYVAEPVDGVWILGIDACNYEDRYDDLSWVAGRISPTTMAWIEDRLEEARAQSITVFGLAHHGFVEHFPQMALVFGDYLIDDWRATATELAGMGLNIVFTGHHHASDISRLQSDADYLIDIQTGSSATWPCPYRLIRYEPSAGTMAIATQRVTAIDYDTGNMDFQTYALDFLRGGLPDLVTTELMSLGLSQTIAAEMEPYVTPMLLSYYAGDESENSNDETLDGIEAMINSGNPLSAMIGNILLGIWNDATPDNQVLIDLTDGSMESTLP
jgi:3',5'-cyclic AMP phosphodiesterase CpdA